MSNLKQDLDRIREHIRSFFLKNEGLCNEVGIHIFCYDPSDELIIQNFIAV